MKVVNPLAPVAVMADQLAHPIVRQFPRDGSEQTLEAAAVGTGAPPADASCAEQPVRFRRRGPLTRALDAGDLAAIIEYCKLTGQPGEKARARIAEHMARWNDDTQRADRARENQEWCDD